MVVLFVKMIGDVLYFVFFVKFMICNFLFDWDSDNVLLILNFLFLSVLLVNILLFLVVLCFFIKFGIKNDDFLILNIKILFFWWLLDIIFFVCFKVVCFLYLFLIFFLLKIDCCIVWLVFLFRIMVFVCYLLIFFLFILIRLFVNLDNKNSK